jgi:hypothetical protein
MYYERTSIRWARGHHMNFIAGSFSDISQTNLGRRLWEFLNRDTSLACLETTTYLFRPALEGLQPALVREFGDSINSDRIKQMIGRMTRQIMERRGYSLDRPGVKTRVGNLFTSAARYKKLERE